MDAARGERRVALQDLGLCQTCREIVENDGYRDPGAADARLTVADRRIDRDVVSPAHDIELYSDQWLGPRP